MSLVVHGSWSADAFVVWGESSESTPPCRALWTDILHILDTEFGQSS
jgi:hypothetical protein